MFKSYSIAPLPPPAPRPPLIPHIQKLSGTVLERRKIMHEDLLALNMKGT